MSHPVLDLSGVSYGLRLIEAGARAGLVVENPADYTGKLFRFAEGDGFRTIHIGESADGPFRNLMSIPPSVIRGLDCLRLRELGESRDLYVVEMTAVVDSLKEEGESEPEGGMHWHEVDRGKGESLDGEPSWHRHVFLIDEELELEGGAVLPAKSLIVTESDGGHGHKIAEDGNATAEDGEHSHAVKIMLPDGEVIDLVTDESGEHVHQLMVLRTGLDGLHQHILTIAGSALASLSPAQFADLQPEEGEASEDRSPPE